MMKETFIIRTEWYEAISELSLSDQGTIFKMLFEYHIDETKINLNNLNNLSVKLVWKLIEPNLKRNINQYDNRCKTSAQNGKLGGRPPKMEKPKNNLNNLNKPLSDIVSDTDSVLVSDTVSENDIEKPIKSKVKNSKFSTDYKKRLLSELENADFENEKYHEYLKIAKSFQQLFIFNLKEAGATFKIQEKMKGDCVDDIRLMIESDGCTIEQFRQVFEFLKTDKFWKSNILSTGKLRKQFSKLIITKKNNGNKFEQNRTELADYAQSILSELENRTIS